MPLCGAFYSWPASAAVAGERGVAGASNRQGDGVVHANEHSGLRREVQVFALASGDVSGAAGKTETESAHDVAEDRGDERATTSTYSRADNVALDLMLFLNNLAFFNFYIFAALAVGLAGRVLDWPRGD